jgi:hypothetical protein
MSDSDHGYHKIVFSKAVRLPPHCSLPRFARVLQKLSPSLRGTQFLFLAGRIFAGEKSRSEPVQLDIENPDVLNELHAMCTDFGIPYTIRDTGTELDKPAEFDDGQT